MEARERLYGRCVSEIPIQSRTVSEERPPMHEPNCQAYIGWVDRSKTCVKPVDPVRLPPVVTPKSEAFGDGDPAESRCLSICIIVSLDCGERQAVVMPGSGYFRYLMYCVST